MIDSSRRFIRIPIATGLLLVVPLLAMQVTDEVVWDPADFAVAGVLLAGAGLLYELATSGARKRGYRLAVGVALAAALLLVWTTLAVGLIGNEEHPANLLYIGVLVVALAGTAVARLESRRMAWALFATAFAQAAAPLIAVLFWRPAITSNVAAVLGLSVVFVALWGGSASLFLRASTSLDGQPTT